MTILHGSDQVHYLQCKPYKRYCLWFVHGRIVHGRRARSCFDYARWLNDGMDGCFSYSDGQFKFGYSVLEKVQNAASITDKVNVFNTVLADVINKHAPIVNRKIVIRLNKQWYTDDIWEAKKIQRSAEKKWSKTHLEVIRQAFVNARENTNKLITAAKQIYTKNKISDSKSNPKELLLNIIKHSKPGADLPQSDDNRELAPTFADYFDNKPEHIRKELDNTNVSSVNNSSETCETSLNSFRPTTEDAVKNIIKSMPNKTCSLDAFPTWVAIQYADLLSPALRHLINCSLDSGEMPILLKRAVVRPLLKKVGLDVNDFKNYRPVSNLPFL
ncbi:hypothetical protein ElyMa_004162100 [Elysia marginata]|uniref:Uncharacterized protein n=1 Tax=Elysia marginata TaxID=1093978 RepID=A0AAV4GI41_9GAST|nr:hypothetical protein ElyMa_004162100 [Elysia marginata]